MPEIDDQLAEAHAAAAYAQDVRVAHRRRSERGSPSRERALAGARDRLRTAMEPLRVHLGRIAYARRELTDADYARIADASASIQSERRKLWKMGAR